MDDETKNPPLPQEVEREQESPPQKSGGGGGWGFFSNLQKAAEEISRNAAAVAEKAAKSIADMQVTGEDSESSKGEEEREGSSSDKEESADEEDKRRRSALEKLGNASEDSILGQGLKVLDRSVENFASGAWQALGSAWKGGSNLVQKFEHSAANLAESIQHGGVQGTTGSVAPSLLETGKAFTAKGMQVLEYVGKETLDLLITETGIDIEKTSKGSEEEADEDHLLEEVTFDRCFYIYGGPEHLEELEALSNHYVMLFNRKKAKLSSEEKSAYDGKLKLVQQVFSLGTNMDGSGLESGKGKKIETTAEGNHDEIKLLHDTSVSKAADMAAGFSNALAGLTVNDINQRTTGRLETLHSEGVHRLSEMCCSAVSQLLMLGKSIISNANKIQEEDDDLVTIEWPEDSIEKAKLVRTKVQSMAGYVEAVSSSFVTGISDVVETYAAAIKGAKADSNEKHQETSVREKANTFSELLHNDGTTAIDKIQDGLQYLSSVVLATSIPAA